MCHSRKGGDLFRSGARWMSVLRAGAVRGLRMYILIDSREKPRAITKIIDTFQQRGIRYDTCKLYIGDYQDHGNPRLVVDRKQNVNELATNCTTDRDRFKRELERAKETGTHVVVLVEQKTYGSGKDRKALETIEDLMLWKSKYCNVPGERVFRVLNAWTVKYPLTVRFCAKKDTGAEIIKILGGEYGTE